MEGQVVPEVSVIIPTYNRSSMVQAALASISRAAFCETEVIVVDDGSTDDTVPILLQRWTKELLVNYLTIRIVCCPHTGNVSKLRNEGAKVARGKLLLFMDSDVVIDHEFIRQIARFMSMTSRVGAVGGLVYYLSAPCKLYSGGSTFRTGLSRFLYLMSKAEIRQCPYQVTVVSNAFGILREAFAATGGFNELISYMGDESWIQLRLENIGFQNWVIPSARAFHDSPIEVGLRQRLQSFNEFKHSAAIKEPVLVQYHLLRRTAWRLFLGIYLLRVVIVEMVSFMLIKLYRVPDVGRRRLLSTGRTLRQISRIACGVR